MRFLFCSALLVVRVFLAFVLSFCVALFWVVAGFFGGLFGPLFGPLLVVWAVVFVWSVLSWARLRRPGARVFCGSRRRGFRGRGFRPLGRVASGGPGFSVARFPLSGVVVVSVSSSCLRAARPGGGCGWPGRLAFVVSCASRSRGGPGFVLSSVARSGSGWVVVLRPFVF